MNENLYFYRAYVSDVYDGDTCTVDIDLGLHVHVHDEKIRLNRIDAPEVRGISRDEGLESRDFLRGLINGKNILLQTIKDAKEKYGRYLGEVWLEQEDGTLTNINDLMVNSGFAIYKDY